MLLALPLLLAGALPASGQSTAEDIRIPGQWEYLHAEYGEASQKFQNTVFELERNGVRDQTYSAALNRLGLSLYMQKKFDESQQVFHKLTLQDESLYGQESLQVADDMYYQLRSARRLGRFVEAQPLREKTLSIRRKLLGEDHRSVGNSWLDIALNYQRLGRLTEAETAYLRSIAIREKIDDPSHTLLPGALRQYAELLRQMSRFSEADAVMQRAESASLK